MRRWSPGIAVHAPLLANCQPISLILHFWGEHSDFVESNEIFRFYTLFLGFHEI
jgi:hypothetical protein